MTEIPLFPLETVLFPGGPLRLRIFETRYLDMVRRCLREARGFGVVRIRAGRETGPAEFEDVGTFATIVDFNSLPDGLLGLSCVGGPRFRIHSRRRQADGLNLGEVEWIEPDPQVAVPEGHADLSVLLRTVLPRLGDAYAGIEPRLDDAAWVGYRLAEILPIEGAEKQRCLEIADPLERLDRLAPMIHASGPAGEADEPGSSPH